MKHLFSILVVWAICCIAVAQPVYRFTVKIGIDTESVDSLGGVDAVKQNIVKMFDRVNKAFNHTGRFDALYDFVVDWDAFYIYDGISADEVFKPHPDHDYLVVIDGYKTHPRETGGGWYGADIQTVYHSRTHNDRFNDPFNEQAIDGIIHEFGHSRGVPDIYAMKVDLDKNPVAPVACFGTRCIMDYPYGETYWSDYAVNMINLAGDRIVEIDSLVVAMCTENIVISVLEPDGCPGKGVRLDMYPVNWYSYAVSDAPVLTLFTDEDGECSIAGSDIFPRTKEFGLKYPNVFVKAESDGKTAYAWLPLYEVENVSFDGSDTYRMVMRLKNDIIDGPIPVKNE